MHPPVPMQEELRRSGWITNLLKRSTGFVVAAVIERFESGRQSADGLCLARWIHTAPNKFVAHPLRAWEIHRQRAEPRFAVLKQPRIAAVLLRQFLIVSNDAKGIAKPTKLQQRKDLCAQCKEMDHDAGRVVRSCDPSLGCAQCFDRVSAHRLHVRIQHAVETGGSLLS